ncbi:MAG: hypothetical protein K2X47_20310, partial [Bdellovibrionales bacterium]|nr:hypothetical protein [Bdellovibrionales bacterium]
SSSLFLALLRTVELKTFLYEKILKTSLGNAKTSCRLSLEIIPSRVKDLFHRFGQIVLNLSVAFKQSADTLKETRESIQSAEISLDKIRQAGQATDLLALSWTHILLANEITEAADPERKNLCQ